jgi:hypothetical protein
MLTEAAGIPVGLAVAGANRHDMKLVRETLESIPASIEAKRREHLNPPEASAEEEKEEKTKPKQGLCLDKGYDYDEVREIVAEFGYTGHLRTRGEEKQEKREEGKKARRWVVERTRSWLNRYRGMAHSVEKIPENYLALLHFGCALPTWNKCLLG